MAKGEVKLSETIRLELERKNEYLLGLASERAMIDARISRGLVELSICFVRLNEALRKEETDGS